MGRYLSIAALVLGILLAAFALGGILVAQQMVIAGLAIALLGAANISGT